jgi:Pathogenicity locus
VSTTVSDHQAALRDLRRIPGVGPSIAQDLYELGVRRVADLADADPLELYERRCEQQGVRIDRCLLYVFRCAVYFAATEHPEPHLLKWWNWKDGR